MVRRAGLVAPSSVRSAAPPQVLAGEDVGDALLDCFLRPVDNAAALG